MLAPIIIITGTSQNDCDGVLTFQADVQDGEVFVLDTNVTAFCMQCVNPITGIADTDILWLIVGGMWSL